MGTNTDDKLRALGLSPKEEKVLMALRDGANTPLLAARKTGISRPAIYAILKNLKKRGLAEYHTQNGRKHWRLCDEMAIDRAIADAKRALLHISDGQEEIRGMADSSVIVYRGAEAIRKLMNKLLTENKGERLYGFQGDAAIIDWDKIFSLEDTNRFNRTIKSNRIIVEAITPDGWFEKQAVHFGAEWAKDFEGRMTRVNVIDPKYFAHGGQIFVFKNSLYLLALNEEIVIEIRNSEIQKMVCAFFMFMQDHSRLIDANELLRGFIAESGKERSKKPP